MKKQSKRFERVRYGHGAASALMAALFVVIEYALGYIGDAIYAGDGIVLVTLTAPVLLVVMLVIHFTCKVKRV
jgi:hypothetical protein